MTLAGKMVKRMEEKAGGYEKLTRWRRMVTADIRKRTMAQESRREKGERELVISMYGLPNKN